jgi:hypothetical protein
MLTLKFRGWFQCRLPTDPDPSDEPRGVSGFTYAAPGEPDLDRIIRFQPSGATWRVGCPPIGVHVTDVFENGSRIANHALCGGAVELLHNPKFLGQNGIVAPLAEPIVPFHLRIRKNRTSLARPHADNEVFPFRELSGQATNYCPGEIGEATGMQDVQAVWRERINELHDKYDQSSDEMERAALQMRMHLLREGAMGMAWYFWGKVPYFIPLNGTAELEDPNHQLTFEPNRPWAVDFWMGGWDTDALSGYLCGFLSIPFALPGSG